MRTTGTLASILLGVATAPAAAQTVVDCLVPDKGFDLGGTLVTVAGSDLDDVTAVTIGGVAVENLEALDPTELIFNAPPGGVGTVDVVLTAGSGPITLAGGFEYVACQSAQGSCLSFDGLNDVAIFGPVTQLGAHTIEAWVKPDSLNAVKMIVGHLNSASTACAFGMYLAVRTGGELGYVVDHSYQCNVASLVSGEATVAVWTHLAGTYDGTTQRVYLNGALVDETVPPGFAPSSWMTAGAAQFFNGFQLYYAGALDEVRVWNVVRSPQQIRGGMHRSLAGNESGLVGYWRMDEGSGQSVGDASASAVVGVLGTTSSVQASDPVWIVSDAPVCLPADPCPGDVTEDGVVDVTDLLSVLAAWNFGCSPADVTNDSVVNVQDVLTVLAGWGPCGS